MSNSGRAFFVLWSLLAVPSLTILISNMGDTIVKWFADLTNWVGSITVLPGDNGFRATTKSLLEQALTIVRDSLQRFTPPGILGDAGGHTMRHPKRMDRSEHENRMLDRLADRLTTHIEGEEVKDAQRAEHQKDDLERDMQFYHYVLARECRNVQKDLSASPPVQYTWQDWEYFLKLMGNEDDPEDFPGQEHPDILVPDEMRTVPSNGSDATITETDGAVDRETEKKEWKRAHDSHKKLTPHPDRRDRKRHSTFMGMQNWSWLSSKSPLMGNKSESEWILERLSAALERELNRQRKGYRRQPPISMSDVKRQRAQAHRQDGKGGKQTNAIADKEQESLEKAARSEV